jgi:hypothetical protein
MDKNDVVKFMYVQDPECPGRVLTIAWRRTYEKVQVAFAINRVVRLPSRVVPVSYSGHEGLACSVQSARPHYAWFIVDKFSKKAAKKLARARLEENPNQYVLHIPEALKVPEALLTALFFTGNLPDFVAKFVSKYQRYHVL